jgi:hypothetical protein
MRSEMKAASTLPFSLVSLFLLSIAAVVAVPSLECQGAGGDSSGKLTVTDGTVLHLVLMDDLQGKKMKAGDLVHFEVREDLVVERQILIRTGSVAIGHIALVDKNGIAGKSGKMRIHIDSVNAVDGTQVHLRGDPEVVGGKNGPFAGARIAPDPVAALFIHGWDAKIPVGTMLNAFADGDQPVLPTPKP